ncbi:TlpA disulfide reductase family protein [Pontibacter sp. SGAir0037]|uniref:TlpA family protein disulfide reductase n=1 Tax=Pontibacter sp. SGAir0037 TaxID=2571030 RepID=UPI0010CCEC02|nr:TlpA disulfide reductase family protein [Pontibacter sp. SGAir0037]QCR25126.1 TlpA family protein disulfide reductase [Pontibacter sp. SGAir0037]
MIAILKSRFLLLAAALTVLITFHVSAQEVKVIKYEGLEKLRQAPGDTLYIVNFWATWCGPCVKELPYFEAANQQYKDQPVKVILVSMDAVQDLDKKVTNFVKKRNLQSRLYLLDEVDGNSWIDKLEPKWTGAIPATIMFNNKRKQYVFFEGEMKEAQLQQLIQQHKP